MKNLYLIGGTMGVGKTTVCRILKQELPNCVFLDGDWCWDSSPFQVTEETKGMVMDNICHLLNNFIGCSAYDNVLFCWVMHQQAIWDELLSRLDFKECTVHCISLVAEETALRSRLLADVAAGVRTADVVERSVSRLLLYRDLNTVLIDTTEKTANDVAMKILAL